MEQATLVQRPGGFYPAHRDLTHVGEHTKHTNMTPGHTHYYVQSHVLIATKLTVNIDAVLISTHWLSTPLTTVSSLKSDLQVQAAVTHPGLVLR